MKKGFTLAEVLITLGIIGVVAALTIPATIQSYRKQEVVSKLKKVYSIVNQAIRRSEVEYGEFSSWTDLADCYNKNGCTYDEAVSLFNKYIGKNLEIINIEKRTDDNDNINGFYVYLKDGSILDFDLRVYDAMYFINKKAIDNTKIGVNTFRFRLQTVELIETSINNRYGNFEPYATYWNGTRDDLINSQKPKFGCGDEYHAFCAKLIQYDGWQISNDYPLKF